MIDISPTKLGPTWRNKRLGEDHIAKRLDHFLISNWLVEEPILFRQWVGSGGESDHYPIFMEIAGATRKPASPFKFNSGWLKEESFIKLVKEVWAPLGPTERVAVQFARNLKSLKIATKSWEKRKKQQLEQDIISMEEALQSLYDSEKGGFSTPTEKEALLSLEKNRRELLQAREEEWRQKSRALWLHSGDENTKFFQAYAKGRKLENTIWGLKDQMGRQLSSFEDLARLGSQHFKSLYTTDRRVSIDATLQMALYFPHFVEEEENLDLMAEVTKQN
jgi:hypothetical protein